MTPDAGPGASAEQLNGSSVKLTFPVRSTDTEVLAVPVAALSVAADGTSRVEVEDDPGKPTRFVTVTPGLAAEGKVAISIVGKASLREGDQVVVGSGAPTDISGSSDTSTSSEDSAPTSSRDSAAPLDPVGASDATDEGDVASESSG